MPETVTQRKFPPLFPVNEDNRRENLSVSKKLFVSTIIYLYNGKYDMLLYVYVKWPFSYEQWY